MDIGTLRGLITLALLVLFLGLWFWSWSRKRKTVFEEMSQLPLEDDGHPPADNNETERLS